MRYEGLEDVTTHPDDVRLAAYAEGTLRGPQLATVEAHLAACVECRSAAADVALLLGAASSRRRRRWIGVSAAATATAAAVALLVVAEPFSQGGAVGNGPFRPGSDAVREGLPAIEVVAPAEKPVPSDSVRFIWRGRGADVLYRLTVTDGEGRVLWEQASRDTVLDLAAEVELEGGRSYLWFLDAALPDGGVATTGVRRLRIR